MAVNWLDRIEIQFTVLDKGVNVSLSETKGDGVVSALVSNHMAYDRVGLGDRVVLLHPIGLDRRFWARVTPLLAENFELCVFDMPGHGASPISDGPVTIEGFASALEATMRADGLGPAIVVGCSLGGMVAQALALQAPDLVRGLVLANTNYTQTEKGRTAMNKRAEVARTGMAQVVETCLERWFSDQVAAADPEGLAQIRAILLAGNAEVHARSWEAIGNLDLAKALPGIAAPALVIAGSDDKSIPHEKSKALTGLLPQGRLRTLQGAGHLTPFERPVEFAEMVRGFAQEVQKWT